MAATIRAIVRPSPGSAHQAAPGLCVLITTLTVGGFRGLAPVAIFVVLIYAVSRVPARRVLSSMAPLLAIVVVVAVLNLFTDQSGRILWQLGFLPDKRGLTAFCRLYGVSPDPDDGRHEAPLRSPRLRSDLTAGFERLLCTVCARGAPCA